MGKKQIYSNNKIYLFLRSLFFFDKKNIIFLSLSYIIPLLMTILIYTGSLNLVLLKKYLVFAPFYVIVILFLYKKFTNCNEFDLFKVAFQFIFVLAVINLISVGFLLPLSANKFLLIIARILHFFSFLIGTSFVLSGLTNLFFQHKINIKEIFFIFIGSIIISIISSVDVYYKGIPYLLNLFNINLIISASSGVFLFYSYQKIEDYVSFKKKALTAFLLLGLVIFALELANGLLLIPSSAPMITDVDKFYLFLLNFKYFLFYSLFGIFLNFYLNRKSN